MSLHPLAAHFSSVTDAYERGRPEYPPAAVGALAAELGLVAGDPVLDLAAGTGKLTRALLAFGLDVVAVEPQDALREALAAHIDAERVRPGLAEDIPLAASSVAAVTVADAFHWFDRPRALAEIRRVLRPGGGLAVLSVAPDWGGAPWAHELGTLVQSLRPEHPHYDGPSWQQFVTDSGEWAAPREVRVTTSQDPDPQRLVDYVGSISWIAALPEQERTAMLAQTSEIVQRHGMPERLTVHLNIGLTSPA